MGSSSIRRLLLTLALATLSSAAWAQNLANVIFLEPVGAVDTRGAEIRASMPLYRRVADPARYTPWLENQSARYALRLYRAAYEIAHPNDGTPDYYVALVPGGNHAAVGFRVQTGERIEEHPKQPYILLDAQPDRFETTLLHETAHVAMAMLAGGRQLDGKSVSAIPHTTAALSDRATAFSEGYAIHFETLAAHLFHDDPTRQRFHREQVLFGDGSEYFHQSSDLASFSQNVARYLDVRDNNFAFEPAFQGPDYLRVQMEKARDFASLRSANQLLQSEGFYASFFFLWVVRGAGIPTDAVIEERERQVLLAMHAMFAEDNWDASSPWLVRFVSAYMKQFPEQKAAMADALNDLSHGVFVDPDAARLWKEHYLATLSLDQKNMNIAGIMAARKKWHDAAVADAHALYSQLGPEIACRLPGTKVRLAAFGEDSPVVFDLNTAPAGILRIVPGISESEVASWIEQRGKQPFLSVEDFKARAGLRPATLAALKF
ncbi:MAG: type II secretion system protein GspK [Bryobacteraceae bacterium]|jgi:DNA uptake protein ComE-like DNA-binding protein